MEYKEYIIVPVTSYRTKEEIPSMKELFLGEYIKQERLKQGITQEQLCEGICDPITISRMENGKQMPSYNRIRAFLQRPAG